MTNTQQEYDDVIQAALEYTAEWTSGASKE